MDTGGTFTDLVLLDGDRFRIHKVPSTPRDPSEAIRTGIRELVAAATPAQVIHGTTVATNAVLTRELAPTALVTNAGLEDVIEIGRQDRPDLYDPFVTRPDPPVPPALRFGVRGRLGPHGERIEPLDERALAQLIARIPRRGARSIAISFLHAYANAADEERAAGILAATGLPITCSSRLRPEFREYERTVTTALNAALVPVMARYLARLGAALGDTALSVMHSGGGMTSAERAAERPIETVLSGPAGGVAAAEALARALGVSRLITFDMGGTSTDVSLIDGVARLASATEIAGLPVRMPVLDIHTVGAGGGSIARVDEGGALAVGPASAGAVPGPACYGRGGREVTVTDADVFLGRIQARHFLGGRMSLDEAAAAHAIERLARRAGLGTAAAALGVTRVVEASMARALRKVSVERGHDPAGFALLAFGGAGPVHAVALAREVGIGTVLVPPVPGIFSALGMVRADVVVDASRTRFASGRDAAVRALRPHFHALVAAIRGELRARGFAASAIEITPRVDVRYVGQSHEIEVPFDDDYADAFHRAHQRLHGHAHPDRAIEVVTLRVRGRGRVARPAWPVAPSRGRSRVPAPVGSAAIVEARRKRAVPIFARAGLGRGQRLMGPAIVVEETATTFLPSGSRAKVGRLGELWIEVGS
ncbi:MAG: hydantoinase/oxoprolinase family protein [bacterium]